MESRFEPDFIFLHDETILCVHRAVANLVYPTGVNLMYCMAFAASLLEELKYDALEASLIQRAPTK